MIIHHLISLGGMVIIICWFPEYKRIPMAVHLWWCCYQSPSLRNPHHHCILLNCTIFHLSIVKSLYLYHMLVGDGIRLHTALLAQVCPNYLISSIFFSSL